jgi:hypothetical protein
VLRAFPTTAPPRTIGGQPSRRQTRSRAVNSRNDRRQASRIEKLLRLQVFQLNNIFTQVTASQALVAPPEMLQNMEWRQGNTKMLQEMKRLVIDVMDQLNKEIEREDAAAAADMKAYQELLERDLSREPMGFRR